MRRAVVDFADRFAREVEERKLWWLGSFTILYVWAILPKMLSRPLWFDELFTYHLARLGSLRDLWSALAAGFDLNPPLYYVLTRLSCGLIENERVATRLAAVAGFWLMCVCVFWVVRRHTSALPAAVAMVLPLVTSAYEYAFEGRPYALVLGCAGLAWLSWQSVEGRRRVVSLAGLALSSAAAVSSHYYAVLAVFAIGLGEVCRSFVRKRIDAPVWLMMGAGLSPLLAYLPLIRSAMTGVLSTSMGAQVIWSRPSPGRLLDYYAHLLAPGMAAAVLGLALVVLAARLGILGTRPDEGAPPEGLPLHEIVAAGAFVLMPLFLYIAASLGTKYYLHRYAVAGVVGCASLLGFGLHQAARGRHVMGLIVLSSILACFVVAQLAPPHWQQAQRIPVLDATDPMYPKGGPQPIVVTNSLLYLRMHYYGSAELLSRIRYVSDAGEAVRQPDFGAELAVRGLRHWAPIRVEEYADFITQHSSFWVYHTWQNQGEWLVQRLAAEGWRVELRRQDHDLHLFLVMRGVGEADRAEASRLGAKDCGDGRRVATAREAAAARSGALR